MAWRRSPSSSMLGPRLRRRFRWPRSFSNSFCRSASGNFSIRANWRTAFFLLAFEVAVLARVAREHAAGVDLRCRRHRAPEATGRRSCRSTRRSAGRRACASPAAAGSCAARACSASWNSSSSGIVDQRKYDSREARAYSSTDGYFCGGVAGLLTFGAEQETRRREHGDHRLGDAVFERLARRRVSGLRDQRRGGRSCRRPPGGDRPWWRIWRGPRAHTLFARRRRSAARRG